MAVAIVTGGSGGIGSEIVRSLGETYDVAIHYYSNEAGAKALEKEMQESTDRSFATYQCDIADPAEVEHMIDRITEELGEIEVLVNNGASGTSTSLVDATPEYIDRKVAVNLQGAMYCTKYVLPRMRDRTAESNIVHISSSAGIHGSRRDPSYGAAKGGLISFSKSIARAYTSEGIFSNVVAPGPTDTEMYPAENVPTAEQNMRISRLIQPEEIAEVVDFFASNTAVSGEILEVDGGRDI